MKTAQLATLCFTCLLGIMPLAASAQPYVISTDGNEVTDQKTGLVWRRCSEGMSWNGSTCAGTASTYTHEAALQRAADQADSTGIAWRLPNIKELSSIADKTLSNPAIDATAFPVTPASWFWSASPYVGDSTSAWFVLAGYVSSGSRSSVGAHVRLVRAGQ
ncbi:MAG: hypothetical protein A2V79_06365 [Betaproteobacteria bacterium RBG_16_56_24]|nr:MAG: hypothetical protein A2V79_06365 [Betaproteobacteria bacterium RBG_16_56_24]